jgi:ABC-2 type transport system ATP-binding protein
VGAALDCNDLHKRFGARPAVDGVSFSVAEGECYGLLGPNGAGKTTTISMVCGLLDPDTGTVRVFGEPAVAAKGDIGYVPQEIALYPELSAAENLKFFGELYGLSGARLAGRVDAVLGTVGLADRAREKVGHYSGGMKRRVNIAAGLLHEPRLLVLDEPTVGVDPQSRNAILETVSDLAGSGMAVVYTTHYMEEASRLCDRIGIIDAGRIVAEGTRRELIARLGAGDRIRLSGVGDRRALATVLRGLDGVTEVRESPEEPETLHLAVRNGPALLGAVVGAAGTAGFELTGVEVVEPDLEDVFLSLTGKELRD